jgi:hypothetical protein
MTQGPTHGHSGSRSTTPLGTPPMLRSGPEQRSGSGSLGKRRPSGNRQDPPQSRTRWLSKHRLLGLAVAVAVLLIGAGAQCWRANGNLVKTDSLQTNVELMPNSLRVNGTVARVFVDAREGTVLIDFRTVPPDTSRPVSSAAPHGRGRLAEQVGGSSSAQGHVLLSLQPAPRQQCISRRPTRAPLDNGADAPSVEAGACPICHTGRS